MATDPDRTIADGASNAEYDCADSAKILAQIGKAFAEASIRIPSSAT